MSAPTLGRKPSAHHVVIALRVTGGFLSGTNLEFADGLNCFIGGRGAGKTTALEFLRYGLGLMPDPKTNAQRHRAVEALVRANLGNGRLSIELRTKTNMRYTAGRATNESVQVLNEAGTAVPIALDRDQIFSADIFSQNEIEEIASSPAAQLELLDRFQQQETAAIARDLEQLQRQLEQSSVDLRRLDEDIDDLRGKGSEVPVIEEKLKGLAEVGGPDAARVNVAHATRAARTREEKVPELVLTAMQRVVREIRASEAGFQTSIGAQLDSTLKEGVNREVFHLLDADIRTFAGVLSSAVTSIANAMAVTEPAIRRHEAALAERHALQEAEYRELISQSDEQGGRAAERLALQAALANAVSAANEQQAKEKQRQGLATARRDLLKRTSELRDQRFALRKRLAERLTQQFSSIRVTVAQAAELQRYRDLIAEALKGAGLKHGVVAERLAQVLLPSELSEVVMNRDYKSVMQRAGFDEDRAKKIVDALRTSSMSYEIEIVDLDDRPCIELLDGDKFKESSHLSTGQRCTTILPILLVQSERPLLIDQPEDNLDNAFVYDTIVKALRDVKGSRQVIFVTHNPNIPVLGEAERVFVFSSDGQHGTLRQVGTVDDCRDQIERILEGGREAFLQRKTRYGH